MTRQDIEVHHQQRRHSTAAASAATAAIALVAALTGCAAGTTAAAHTAATAATSPAGAPAKAPAGASQAPGTPTAASPAPKPATAKPSARPVGAADAGTLPQTEARPKTTGTAFGNAVHDIWLAVSTGNPGYARPAFFPEKAYEQVKAIADPQSDWQDRLWNDFTLDLAAVHKLVGKNPKLTKVVTPTKYAQWIPVGGCYNSIGYWHLPGSRLVYRQGGVTRSFGIASFISWRGDWYVVHLGALSRSGAYGIVDDPETGPGIPGPAGGC